MPQVQLKEIIDRLRKADLDPVAFAQHAKSDMLFLLELVDQLAPEPPKAQVRLVRASIQNAYTTPEGVFARLGGGTLN